MVRDFTRYAMDLYSKSGATEAQMEHCLKMVRKPVRNPERFRKIWQNRVYALKESYEMNP